MISFLSDWVKQLVIVVLMAGLAEMLVPRGQFKGYVQVVVGLVVLLAVLNPVVGLLEKQPAAALEWPLSTGSGRGAGTAVEVGGAALRQLNTELALARYRQALAGRLHSLVARVPEAELEAADFLLEERPESPAYGQILQVNLRVLLGGHGARSPGGAAPLDEVRDQILNLVELGLGIDRHAVVLEIPGRSPGIE